MYMCKLQPSQESCKPMWQYLKYSYTHAYLYTKYFLLYYPHESYWNTCIDQSTNGLPQITIVEELWLPDLQLQMQAC